MKIDKFSQKPSAKPLYSIRQVMDLTGLSEFVLRGWEGRYKAFRPIRTKSRRRLYSADDVLKAKLLWELTQGGRRIGGIARLSTQELKALVADRGTASSIQATQAPAPVVSDIIKHGLNFDWKKVHQALAKKRPPEEFLLKIILPLTAAINRLVMSGQLTIAQEHIFSAMIKESLSRIPNKKISAKNQTRMIFACPEGDHHDLGLLIASCLAKTQGVDVLFLGAHMPKRDLAETALRYRASHVVIASTVGQEEGAQEHLLSYIHFLDRALQPKIRLWLAGRNAVKQPIHLKRAYKVFLSFQDFHQEIINGNRRLA